MKTSESRNISQYFSNTIEQTNIIRKEENYTSLPVLPQYKAPNIMKTMESLPFLDEFDGKKANYEKYMEAAVTGKKTQRYDRLMSPKKNTKESSTFERRDVISQSSIRSPRDSRISKRKLKLTNTEMKQLNKDLKMLQQTTPSEHFVEDSDNNETRKDPAVANAKVAAEMGIEYPPDFNDNSDEDHVSQSPFQKEAQKPIKFPSALKNIKSPRQSSSKVTDSHNPNSETPMKIRPQSATPSDHLESVQSPTHTPLQPDLAQIPEADAQLSEKSEEGEDKDRKHKKDKKQKKHKKHKKHKKDKKAKHAKNDEYEDEEFEQEDN